MTANRLVVILTPLVFAPLAGYVAALVARHLPGVDIDPSQLEEIFIAGALLALAPAAQWLQGWQKHEAREAERVAAADDLDRLDAEEDEPDLTDDDLLELDEDGFDLDGSDLEPELQER